jgi:hypothetical protein
MNECVALVLYSYTLRADCDKVFQTEVFEIFRSPLPRAFRPGVCYFIGHSEAYGLQITEGHVSCTVQIQIGTMPSVRTSLSRAGVSVDHPVQSHTMVLSHRQGACRSTSRRCLVWLRVV